MFYCDTLTHLVTIYYTLFATYFSLFVSNIEEERKVMNDERREHGTVDKSFSEQQIHESNDHTLIVWKNWSPSTSGTRSYVSQAGKKNL